MAGYEQLVPRARDRPGATRSDCLGQRGHTWGAPDWERIESTRTLAAWLDDGSGVVLSAVRPGGQPPATSRRRPGPPCWAPPAAARRRAAALHHVRRASGRQRRAGLELWVGEGDGYPRHAAGEVVCGTTLDLGQLRLDCAFFAGAWRAAAAVGRYDVLRRA